MQKKNQEMIELINPGDKINSVIDWFFSTITLILSLFYDARIVLHAVLFLIVIDQVMGVTYALNKKKFSWKTFSKVFMKIIIYIAAILAAFVYERYLLNSEPIYFTKIVAALVGAKEIVSSYTKFAKMTGIEIFQMIWEKIKP